MPTKRSSTIEISPALQQFVHAFLTSPEISDKLRVVELSPSKALKPIKEKVEQHEKSASAEELAFFEFVLNYGFAEMYNKSLLALMASFMLEGETDLVKAQKKAQSMCKPLTQAKTRKAAGYVFKEWLIDHEETLQPFLHSILHPIKAKKKR